MDDLAIGVDIGGTKLAAGLVTADGQVRARTRRPTPAGDSAGIVDAAVDAVEDLCAREDVSALPVGVGAAGIIDREGIVRYAPNIPWTDEPLRATLEKRLGTAVTVDNDANAAAWGEYRCGAARDARDSMVMLTVGTGVGGGLVLAGRLVRGVGGLGAEFGHLIVSEGGPLCGCGNRGCLEAVASGTAIGRLAMGERVAGRIPDGSPLLGDLPLTGKSVTAAAVAGDRAAREILQDVGRWLGVGIASLVNALDPEIVVVGGGAMAAGDLLLTPARESAEARILGRGYRTMPAIVPAELADDAGLIGAALLALDG